MATARKMNRAKTSTKSAAKTPAQRAGSNNGSKAMAGKKSAGKAGIQALLTAFRGKPKAAPAPKTKPKTQQAAKPTKAAAKGKAPAASAVKIQKPATPAKVVAAKPQKAAPAPKSATPAKNGKNGAPALALKAAAPVQAKGKGAQGKNSAAVAAAAAVQKMTSRLTGRSLEASTEAVCREVACEGLGTTAGYCRLHYIKNWRKIKRKEVILKEGKLNIYIEELVAKYPEKYLEAIRSDLTNDKEFANVIHDLDLDESIDDFEGEGSDSDTVIDTIKREFDDDTETF